MIISIILSVLVAIILGVAFVFAFKHDTQKMKILGQMLCGRLRNTLFRGLVVKTENPNGEIWITRWEDLRCDGPALLIYLTYLKPFAFPLIIANKRNFVEGLPFEEPFSRPSGLKPLGLNSFKNLAILCRKENQLQVSALVEKIKDELTRLCELVSSETILFSLGRNKLKISVNLDVPPEEVKNIHGLAAKLVKKIAV